jgi:hypothetical protein
MSFNIFKRKEDPIYLDCYTYSHYAYNHAKINYAKNYIPDWWKKEPTINSNEKPTIRHCPAFSSFYAKGIVLPSWGEVEITVNPFKSDKPAYEWISSNEDFDLSNSSHPKNQWDGFGGDNLFNIKFVSPWAFKTREKVNFVWSQPTWSNPDTFNSLTILPAVVQFKTQSATEINFVIQQKQKEQKIKIPPLNPLLILHPMTERRIEIRNHLISSDKFNKIHRRSGGMVLTGTDEDAMKITSKRLSETEKFWRKADELNKCPFK